MRFVLLVLMLFPSVALAEGETVFGLAMGTKKSDLHVQSTKGSSIITLSSVPEYERGYQNYRVRWTEKTGVCLVAASTATFESRDEGLPLKAEFERLLAFAEKKYGKAIVDRHFKFESNWKDRSKHYMRALANQEVSLVAIWNQVKNAELRGTDIMQVILKASAPTRNTANVVLQVKFINYPDCKKAIRKIEQDGPL
ncbi:MAG: hypothetical protein KAI28_04150 [Sphingomonadales bacterium]|nr:hypothetical protein [Sphingomonadales bacterium]